MKFKDLTSNMVHTNIFKQATKDMNSKVVLVALKIQQPYINPVCLFILFYFIYAMDHKSIYCLAHVFKTLHLHLEPLQSML